MQPNTEQLRFKETARRCAVDKMIPNDESWNCEGYFPREKLKTMRYWV